MRESFLRLARCLMPGALRGKGFANQSIIALSVAQWLRK